MNIDIVGRIRPPVQGETLSLTVTEGKRVYAQQGGISHNFQILYQPDASNEELFSKTIQPLLDLFIAGFNTSVIIYGESGSGKSFTAAGEQGGSRPGIIPQAINYVTANIQQQNSMQRENSLVTNDPSTPRGPGEERGRVLMYMFEIYNEVIKDLMAARGSLSGRNTMPPMELQYTAERGNFVKNLLYEICQSPAEATTAFWQAWFARNVSTTDFGPYSNFSTHVFQLELYMMTDENPLPNRSVFTVIRLPGAEKLAEDMSRVRARDGPTLSKSIVSFNRLTADLARQPDPVRVVNYSDSKLTSLLENILGGNSKTRAICCLKPVNNNPDVMAALLNGCGLLSQVKNYPIINDCLAQDLVTQYRARLDTTLQLGGVDLNAGAGMMSRPELHDQLLKVTSDNAQLRERSDRLFQRMEQTQEKMAEMAKSKSEISSKLIESEEEKLRVSKALVELQLSNNRIAQEYEAENFELKAKVLNLENQLVEFELEKERFARNHNLSAEQTKQLEENQKSLAEEFVSLKKKHISQTQELEDQVKKNEELRTELAKLIETEAALINLRDNVDRRRQAHDDASKELEHAREVLRDAKVSSFVKENTLERLKARRAELHRELPPVAMRGENYGKAFEGDGVVARMRKSFDEETIKLEEKLEDLKSQLTKAYSGIQKANKEAAEQLTLSQAGKREQERLIEQNSQLQAEIKEINENYRSKLWKYVKDIADFVDNGPPADSSKRAGSKSGKPLDSIMKNYVEGMLKDMKSAFRSREEQLSRAAHKYKIQARKMSIQHEKLLIHYRTLRDQLEMRSSALLPNSGKMDDPFRYLPPIDLGPDPSEMVISENELATENTLELNKLRALLAKAKADAAGLKAEVDRQRKMDKAALNPLRVTGRPSYSPRDGLNRASDPLVRMRDLHSNAQLERERAELLSRATVAEQHLREQQEYIDTHLTRYKQEIVRLRRMLVENGIRISDSPLSPELSPRRKYGKTGYGF